MKPTKTLWFTHKAKKSISTWGAGEMDKETYLRKRREKRRSKQAFTATQINTHAHANEETAK